MACSACGGDNPPGARFCNGCGAALSAACAECGRGNPPASRFCNECGHPLTVPVRSNEPVLERASAAPASYTPLHLAEKILAARADLAGERKQVTVLFADVTGSTALIQGLDPEEAGQVLTPAVQAMVDAVHHFEGTVNRVHGDGITAHSLGVALDRLLQRQGRVAGATPSECAVSMACCSRHAWGSIRGR